MFQKVGEAEFVRGEHDILKFWDEQRIFDRLRAKNAGKKPWSFIDGPITANNPMGVHHAWGRTYKDAIQRYWAMNGRDQRYQNGFDCQGLWVEVEVEKQLDLGAKSEIEKYGVDKFVWACKKRVLKYAAIQTEQSIRLGYWMDWDDPATLRRLADAVGVDASLTITTPKREPVTAPPEQLVERLGNPDWGGSYFTFSTENNETIWAFLKKCFERGKIYRGHDVMPWSGKAGSAYSQMEVADGRKLTTHRALFVRFPLLPSGGRESPDATFNQGAHAPHSENEAKEYLLVWTTTPWTLTSNVAAMVNPDLEYVKLQAKRDGAIYYFAKDNLEFQRLAKEFKEGFGRPEWQWPKDTPKLKTLAQIFKEQGGYEALGTVKGADLIGRGYGGPFDDLIAQQSKRTSPPKDLSIADQVRLGIHDFIDGALSRAKEKLRESTAQEEMLWLGYRAKKKELQGRADSLASSSLSVFEKQIEYAKILDQEHEIDGGFSANYSGAAKSATERIVDAINLLFSAANADGVLGSRPNKIFTLDEAHLMLSNLGIEAVHQVRWKELAALESLINHWQQNSLSYLKDKIGAKDDWDLLAQWDSVDSENQKFKDGFLKEISLKVQQILNEISKELKHLPFRSGIECHRVIDGGRDFKGSPNVVAGEGTGIVHCAPGCGDIDHQIGLANGLVSIAPLGEDGKFLDGFGQFTGLRATDPATVDLIIEDLKNKGFLVAVERYPHIYPFCWRTGDELVFRLVDEWFINMDWREEIQNVTRQIEWLPKEIQGQERELEWLANMRDWMISKKRYWGLALPIWENPHDPSDFEVIGSLAELKERAVEGWDEFAGHTPHKPWIDRVKIKSQKTGATLQRVPDVGNPWLDAGIVPFSTVGYNTHRELWEKWYPADLVSECFPGQFRNWFYSLLSMATMMDGTPPFKTLFGYRLVMNEEGKPMHKSDGTAIWFEEAAEQLGVDSMRWMYLQQNPASDLKFGTRHPDQRVTLQTPNGPSDKTIDGVETCLVTSGPADEVRRQVLLPLWNSYAFFVNYARLDGFDPSLPPVPAGERPEIDRWILSNLQSLITSMRSSIEGYDFAGACNSAATFIDDLSNWYIRRNRRRFWRSKSEGGSAKAEGWDPDKLAAYQTLYEVLLTLTKLLAPFVPFLAERMYQNLTSDQQKLTGCASSVHLCDYPTANEQLLDADLNQRMSLAQLVVKLGHKLREQADQRVRQPLPELRFACTEPAQKDAISRLRDVIAEELNVKQITPCDRLDDIVKYVYKANLKTLGPKYGKQLNAIKEAIPTLPPEQLTPLRSGESITLAISGSSITLEPEEVIVGTEQAAEWHCADERGVQVALSSHLTPELIQEGQGRDFIRHVQQLRKDEDLEIQQRIRIFFATEDEAVAAAIAAWSDVIRNETLADALTREETPLEISKLVTVGEAKVYVRIEVA